MFTVVDLLTLLFGYKKTGTHTAISELYGSPVASAGCERAFHLFGLFFSQRCPRGSRRCQADGGASGSDRSVLRGGGGGGTDLGASRTSRSACLPTSSEPWVAARPTEAAALMVAAVSASGMVILNVTQARCITSGCGRGGGTVRHVTQDGVTSIAFTAQQLLLSLYTVLLLC